MRLLLVEDDALLGDAVRTGLEQNGYTVDWIRDGTEAGRVLDLETFDLVVLDINLPGKSGLRVLREFREKGKKTPVLLLTALESVEDRVKGLDSGADDYVVKPFDLDELTARLRALVRRRGGRAHAMISVGGINCNPATHQVTYYDEPVNLSRREFALLEKLLENVGRVISREQLMQTLYGWGDTVDSNSLEVHIHNLRKKFHNTSIRTIRGVGYMLEEEQKK